MNRIKKLRKEQNLTLKQLGNLIDVKDSTLSQYENGKRQPSTELMHVMANIFRVSIEYISGLNPSLDTATQGIYNVVINTYDPSNFGSYRSNEDVANEFKSTYLKNEMIKSDFLSNTYDISYRIELLILLSNKSDYESLKNKVASKDNDINEYVAKLLTKNYKELIEYSLRQIDDFSDSNSDKLVILICDWINNHTDISNLSSEVLQPFVKDINNSFKKLTNNLETDFALKSYIDKKTFREFFQKTHDELNKIEESINNLRI